VRRPEHRAYNRATKTHFVPVCPSLQRVAYDERRLISQRTKEALAVKRASGVRLGRPPTLLQSVVRHIQRQRARGDSFRKIAEDLNQSGVSTAQGGVRWYAATVRHVLLRTS
jgi:DNA invertase Pin-like site-specific DNA recombinase